MTIELVRKPATASNNGELDLSISPQVVAGDKTATGIWTFSTQPFAHYTRTTNSGSFTSSSTVHVYFPNLVTSQNITIAGTADHENGTTTGTTATMTAAGVYQINTSVEVQRNTGGQFLAVAAVDITVNNVLVASTYHNEQNTVAGLARNAVGIAIKLNIGDVVRVTATATTTGGNWSIGSGAQSQLSIAKIQ